MKIPPKFLYTPKDPESSQTPTQSDEIKQENERVDSINSDISLEEEKSGKLWPYNVEDTLEKLDYEDRKWLLFQLVLCRPIFMEEVMLGFPMSLVADDDVVHAEQIEDGGLVVAGAGDNTCRKKIEGEGSSDKGGCEGTSTSGDISGEEGIPTLDMNELSLEVSDKDQILIKDEGISRNEDKESKEKEDEAKETARIAESNTKKRELLPILVPESEWLLTYCQIDAIPSETRDEFLLNLFLMSPLYSSILESFYKSLETGRINHETCQTYPDEMEWKNRFHKANKGRKVLAKAGMGVDYGCVGYWEELGEGREGVWDVALNELGGWLMRDLPGSHEPNRESKSPKVEVGDMRRVNTKSDQEEEREMDESEHYHTPEWCIAQDYIKMMAFIIQTKTLSLVRQITRPDSSSDSWVGRYRYKALTINDMVKLSVLLTRSPLPLRKLLHDEIRSISAEIVVLFDELEGAECEWVRVDDDLAWDLECIQRGLDDVEYGYLWEGVMTAWYRKNV